MGTQILLVGVYIEKNNLVFFLKDFFLLRFYLFILKRGEDREKERERNINVREKHRLAASHMSPNWDQAHNPGMCPDPEWNQ